MASKLKFTKDGDGDFLSNDITDKEGDTVSAFVYAEGDYLVTFNVNGEVAGLNRQNAVTLALKILKEATR